MPGARIHDWAGTSSGARRCVVRRSGAAYIMRLIEPACSTNCLTRDVCCQTSCESATSAAVGVGAEAHALDRRRAVAAEREHLLARERELHAAGRARPGPP